MMRGIDGFFDEEYRSLRSLAARHLRGRGLTTLQPTALVHEVYLKLARDAERYSDRTHFLCTAATTMRHILVDHARRRHQLKRGGDRLRVTLTLSELATKTTLDMMELNDALDRLEALDERQARIVDLRFFAGFSVEEVAEIFSMSERSVKRDWSMARAWLQRELAGADLQ